MISHKHKFVFVHVPKAAGQSVEKFFLEKEGSSWENRADFLLKANDDPTLGPPRLAHLTATEYVSKKHITASEYQEYFTFSIIRNPWSRVLSFYKYLGFAEVTTFDNFVCKYLEDVYQNEYWFLRPQCDFIYDKNGTLQVDFLGKMENLKKDFPLICEKLHIKSEQLPHYNSSPEKRITRKGLKLIMQYPTLLLDVFKSKGKQKSYKDAYSEKAKEIVGRLYKDDIEKLDYRF